MENRSGMKFSVALAFIKSIRFKTHHRFLYKSIDHRHESFSLTLRSKLFKDPVFGKLCLVHVVTGFQTMLSKSKVPANIQRVCHQMRHDGKYL